MATETGVRRGVSEWDGSGGGGEMKHLSLLDSKLSEAGALFHPLLNF